MTLALDLHIHSRFSPDSVSAPRDIVQRAVRLGLGAIAVSDHNSLRGWQETRKWAGEAGLGLVPAIEYTTTAGHILGLFVEEALPGDYGPLEAVEWQEAIAHIQQQGGLAIYAHPFKRSRSVDPAVLAKVDGIEVFNARSVYGKNPAANDDAVEAAREMAASQGGALTVKRSNRQRTPVVTAGSDAHWLGEIGHGVCVLPDLEAGAPLEAIREALTRATIVTSGQGSLPIYESASQVVRLGKQRLWSKAPAILAKGVLNAGTSFLLFVKPGVKPVPRTWHQGVLYSESR